MKKDIIDFMKKNKILVIISFISIMFDFIFCIIFKL